MLNKQMQMNYSLDEIRNFSNNNSAMYVDKSDLHKRSKLKYIDENNNEGHGLIMKDYI